MGRNLYEIVYDKDELNSLDEQEALNHLTELASDYCSELTETVQMSERHNLGTRLEAFGFEYGTEDGVEYIVASENAKCNFFTERYEKLQTAIRNTDLYHFSCSDPYELVNLIEYPWGDSVYNGYYPMPLDKFVREMAVGKKYYLGVVMYIH